MNLFFSKTQKRKQRRLKIQLFFSSQVCCVNQYGPHHSFHSTRWFYVIIKDPRSRRQGEREREREKERAIITNQYALLFVSASPGTKRGYTLPPFSSFLQPPGRIENSKVPIGRPQPPREEEIRPTRGRAKGMSTRHQTKTNRVVNLLYMYTACNPACTTFCKQETGF